MNKGCNGHKCNGSKFFDVREYFSIFFRKIFDMKEVFFDFLTKIFGVREFFEILKYVQNDYAHWCAKVWTRKRNGTGQNRKEQMEKDV